MLTTLLLFTLVGAEPPERPALTPLQEQELQELREANRELSRRIDLLAADMESFDLGALAPPIGDSEYGLGPAASKIYSVEQGVSIGGYGEFLYEDFESTRDDGSPSGKSAQADALRVIFYFGYKFDDDWVFNSEIEFEHGSTGAGGEASVEFAYIDRLIDDGINVRAGILLVPMGFINELHEPTTFLSAKRPLTEQLIIPSTWRENGVGLFGDVGGFSYRTYLVNGFDGSGFTAAGLRGGRQKGSRALAEDFAWVTRVDWTGTPGLTAGASAYIGDSAQDLAFGVDTTITEAHVEWKAAGFHARALYAMAELDGVGALNASQGLTGNQSVGEELDGHYVELGYDVLSSLAPGSDQTLTPFVRYEAFDTQAKVPATFAANPANDVEVTTWGLAWKPHSQIVLKLDYMDFDDEAGTGTDQVNVSMGYIF